ncbi:YhdT family protein [Gracilibacillus marinus]|jgi:uncharacterized membrane protein YhdT|uniref:YhdT family protein n=1 Tax=Gracilibacillus marinus TaxID=630535 RepID=A0ABV8VV30_9BACI
MKIDSHLDERFKIANREARIGIILVIFNFFWWFGFAYGLGDKDPSEYSFVFGFPEWFFYSVIAGTIIMIMLVFLVVTFLFKDMSIDDKELND